MAFFLSEESTKDIKQLLLFQHDLWGLGQFLRSSHIHFWLKYWCL